MKSNLMMVLLVALSPAVCVSQDKRSSSQRSAVDSFESAIECIATAPDSALARQSDALLRAGGLESILVLAKHANDKRPLHARFVIRAVTGRVTVGDYCFWTIQDQLEDHTSRMDASFSPFSRESIAQWLAERSGMSIVELRREACIGSFRVIMEFEQQHPNYDVAPTLRAYAKKLNDLDAAVRAASNPAVRTNASDVSSPSGKSRAAR